ncbi:threonine/homoserine efflux transporter RhtA [Idiomarina fontislapidosi]|uniref:EamA family transporter n=1 Tax=Idiomarina fontislapidosi TaxID=263723 RepID=A0A432Y8A2_9GAMM|nr:DMT family transporter [Idiomarina fontislapidosi]PYE33805.1 threonine/homoserine efflux transporter RhtA [Idiomarina fontislapidosi]RUO57199.1 EamA family transporter [Idiomarina fontislapidosi]
MGFRLHAPMRLAFPGKWVARSTILVAFAAVCWGISGGIGAILLNEGWSATTVALCRGAFGLVFVGVWLFLTRRDVGHLNRQFWFWSVVAGLGVAGNFSFYFFSIAEGSVTVAATLMYCAPVFIFIISFLLGLETPSWSKVLAILFVIVGIVFLTQAYALDVGQVSGLAVIMGLLSGVSYTVFVFGFKYAAPHGSPQAILTVAFAVLSLVLVLLIDTGGIKQTASPSSLWLLLAIGVLGGGLSFICYVVGLNYTAPGSASILAMAEPITAALFGILFLGELLDWVQVLGVVLILSSVTVLSIESNRRKSVVESQQRLTD